MQPVDSCERVESWSGPRVRIAARRCTDDKDRIVGEHGCLADNRERRSRGVHGANSRGDFRSKGRPSFGNARLESRDSRQAENRPRTGPDAFSTIYVPQFLCRREIHARQDGVSASRERSRARLWVNPDNGQTVHVGTGTNLSGLQTYQASDPASCHVGQRFARIPPMRGLFPIAVPISLLVFAPFVKYPQNSVRVEKVAEGEYWEWRDGHPLKDTSQTWTIWRTQNGYEVEDNLPPDKAAALLAVMGAATQRHMSPELREEFQNGSMTTDIHLQLTKDGAVRELLSNGKKLSEVRQIQVANCLVKENEISCKGREGAAHLKNSGQDQLVYSYPFPLLFTPMLKQSKLALNQTIPIKLG